MKTIRIKAMPEIFDDPICCNDRWSACQFLASRGYGPCSLFKKNTKRAKTSDGYSIREKHNECKECYKERLKMIAELIPSDLHDDTLNDHL